MNVVRLLAEWFVEAYRAAVNEFGTVAAITADAVQEMRTLYVAARLAHAACGELP